MERWFLTVRKTFLARNLAEIRNFVEDNALREAVRGRG